MSEPAYPVIGPCEPWIDAEDVAACCGVPCDPPSVFDTMAEEATNALFEISGRRFNGICTRTVRPCADVCNCWGMSTVGGPWYWSYNYSTFVWGWFNENQDSCAGGCNQRSSIPLAGYPVQSIVEVLIDGQVVPASGYRLDNRRSLTRMDDPGPPYVKNYWPFCQNLSIEADQPGTFQVTYRWGIAPPAQARAAAAELACLLWQSCPGNNNGNCVVPDGTTRITRLGVTIERNLLMKVLDPSQPTGLLNLDIFLRSYWGSTAQRQAAIWSPDIRGYGLRVTP